MEEVFETLLIIDAVRGKHSTGVAAINSLEHAYLVKRVGNPYNLLYDKDYTSLKTMTFKALLGHNRYATQGRVDESNAHPFICGHIVGMHNGTLNYHSDIQAEKDKTDSEAIFQSIADIGVEATIPKLYGAWALVWYDLKAKTLNMIRNKERPLYYVYTEHRAAIVWASEERMLKFALAKTKLEGTDIYGPGDNVLFTWDLDSTFKPLGAPLQTPMEGKAPPKHGSWKNGHGYDWIEDSQRFLGYSPRGTDHKDKNKALTLPAVKDRRKNFRPPYIDAYGKVLNKADFFDVTNEGCSFCGQSMQKWGDEIHILGRFAQKNTAYICGPCAEDDDIFDVFRHCA